MGVDTYGILAERVAEDDVGGFSADPRQRQQIVQLVGNRTAEAFNQHMTAALNCLGFVAIKIDFPNTFFQLTKSRAGVVRRCLVGFE